MDNVSASCSHQTAALDMYGKNSSSAIFKIKATSKTNKQQ